MDSVDLEQSLSLDSVVVATKNQVSSDLAGEAVILELKSGVYYGLDEVGAHIWNLLQEPKSVTDVWNRLLESYEVEPEQCNRELLELLQKLAEAGLIEVRHEATA